MKLRKTLISVGILALAVAGCGGDALEGGDDATGGDETAATGDSSEAGGDGASDLSGAEIIVGSKDFDEQLVLGNISKVALEAAGATVVDQINLGGTDPTRAALVNGEIDTYWSYTGTAWISFFEEEDPIPDRVEQYEAVAERDLEENNLHWLTPSVFNNTYGLAYLTSAGDDLGNPETLSDLAELIENEPEKATLCVESEFPARNDGLPGMEETYGYEFPDDNVTVLDTGVVYAATADRDPCNFGEVFTTDARIVSLDLTVLEDDQSFFPLYNAAPVFTDSVYSEYGDQLDEIFTPIAEALDNDTMVSLTSAVSNDGERPEAVATRFLEENDLMPAS